MDRITDGARKDLERLRYRARLFGLLVLAAGVVVALAIRSYPDADFVQNHRDWLTAAASALAAVGLITTFSVFMIVEKFMAETFVALSRELCEGTVTAFQEALVQEITPQAKKQITSLVEDAAKSAIQSTLMALGDVKLNVPLEYFPAHEAPSRRYQDYFNDQMYSARDYGYFGDFGSFSSYEIATDHWQPNRIAYFPFIFMFHLPDKRLFGHDEEKWREQTYNVATTLYIFSKASHARRIEVGFYRDERAYSFEIFPNSIFLNLPSAFSETGEVFGDTFVYKNGSYFWRTFDNLFKQAIKSAKKLDLYFEIKKYTKDEQLLELIKNKFGPELSTQMLEDFKHRRLARHQKLAQQRVG